MAAPWFFNQHDVISLHHGAPDAKLFYGKEPQQFGLLRLPAGKGPFPLVVIVHGGCWVSTIGDINNAEALSDAITKQGYATWSIEYRSVDQNGGGFPGTFLDVANAVDYLKQIAPKYKLDLQNTIIVGHSSGGHLALWLGARNKLPKNSALYTLNPLMPKAVISMGGVPDLEVARKPAEKKCFGDVIGRLLSEKHKDVPKARYKDTSPYAMLPFAVPQVLIVAALDEVVPLAISDRYLKKAKITHDKASLVEVPYAGHMDLIAPNSVNWPYLLREINSYLGKR